MRINTFFITLLAAALVISAGCSTKASPQAPNIQVTQVMATENTAIQPGLTTEEAAWQKVVSEAKKEGIVTAYSFNWVGDVGLTVKKSFEDKYGIKLEILTGRGAEFEERVKTERRMNQMLGDMTEGSVGSLQSMKMSGLVTSVAADLPALQEKDAWLVQPAYMDPVDKINLGWRQTIDSPWINTNLVKPGEEPRSWKDLLDPKWKGKISLRDPRLNPAISSEFVALLDKKIWDEDYMRALHKQGLFYAISTMDEARQLGAGQIHISAIFSGASGGPFAEQGAPIKAISINQGDAVSFGALAAIAKGPHPNTTKVLINWMFSKEGQMVLGKAQANLMARKDVPDYRPPAARTQMINPIIITPAYLDEGTKRYQEKWYDKVVGR
ncbi:MAG: extracellular solute-binding protein [Dehalococcoidia bacterium]|nr:extracellular solute-binding protein [Dehalococcoidia bacterium]